MREPYLYARKLQREDAIVVLLECPATRRESLTAGLSATSQKFGFTFFSNTPGFLSFDSQIVHGIMVVDGPPSRRVVDSAATHMNNGVVSVSIAFSYQSLSAQESSIHIIDEFKRQYGDKLNFLRPDCTIADVYSVSDQKILDNAVCDSVRVKYFPHQRQASCREWLDDGAVHYFRDAFEAYNQFKLYHRSPTDGYVALRRGDGGFLITATKTSKLKWDQDRVTYVHRFDEATNVIEYSGGFLPSSDAVEASIVYYSLPSVSALVHTHASDRFTRNPAFAGFVQVPRLPYGEPELGRKLASAISGRSSGMVIMDDHGEVFFSTDELCAVPTLRRFCLNPPF